VGLPYAYIVDLRLERTYPFTLGRPDGGLRQTGLPGRELTKSLIGTEWTSRLRIISTTCR
jgi:hypothetical protein